MLPELLFAVSASSRQITVRSPLSSGPLFEKLADTSPSVKCSSVFLPVTRRRAAAGAFLPSSWAKNARASGATLRGFARPCRPNIALSPFSLV